MLYYMWPYDGFIGLTERALDAREWSDALARALWRKDAAGVRELFDHTFWYKTDFKPDWFHLYIAVQQENRELVQLMVTHGARWDAAQTAIAAQSFGDKIKPFKYILAAGGMRIDAPAAQHIDPLAAIAMDRRILAENEKFAGVNAAQTAAFNLTVTRLVADAAQRGDGQAAKKLSAHHTEISSGLDITPLLQEIAQKAKPDKAAAEMIKLLRSLKAAGVPLRAIAAEKLPEQIDDFYTLIPALAAEGALGGDKTALREKMWRSWSYAQEKIFAAADFPMHRTSEDVAHHRALFAEAAKVLCAQDSDLSPQDVRLFTERHSRHGRRHKDAMTHMDETLMAGGFFGNPAFDAQSLKSLAESAPTENLRDSFNRYALGRGIEERGVRHFLAPKRFGDLMAALDARAFSPDAQDTRDIVSYLYSRCPSRRVPEDVTAAMTALRDADADFTLVDPLRYMSSKHPLIAQTMLDLDILRAKDFKLPRLMSKIPPHAGMGGMFAAPGDSGYALREFLYQVVFEREFPEKAAEQRGKTECYQRLYTLTKLRTAMHGHFNARSRPKPSPRPKFPPPPPPPPRPRGRTGPWY